MNDLMTFKSENLELRGHWSRKKERRHLLLKVLVLDLSLQTVSEKERRNLQVLHLFVFVTSWSRNFTRSRSFHKYLKNHRSQPAFPYTLHKSSHPINLRIFFSSHRCFWNWHRTNIFHYQRCIALRSKNSGSSDWLSNFRHCQSWSNLG